MCTVVGSNLLLDRCQMKRLVLFHKRQITAVDRWFVKKREGRMPDESSLLPGGTWNLVVGDASSFTTHIDLRLRMRELGIRIETIDKACTMNW